MPVLYYLVVTIHVLAAMLWLGGMFFLAVVGAPVLREVESPALRQRLFQVLGERFRAVGWIAITILLVTGTLNLYFRGWLRPALTNVAFWHTTTGVALAWKLASVAVMVVTSAVHDFILGPRAGRMKPGSPEALKLRRWSALGARLNAIVGFILVIAAVRLARS